LDTWDGDDVTLSRSYLISSDWFPELSLLEKAPTLGFHMHHNDLVHQPIFCLNLFSKAKTLAQVRVHFFQKQNLLRQSE